MWLFNVRGVRVGVTFGYLAGALLMIPLFVMMILPFLNGSFDSANLDNTIKATDPAWGGLQLSLVWLWLMCWSAWGVDVCATFAPEYKDTARDTKLALRSAALFSLVVYILLPIGFVGGGTPELVSAYDYVGAMDKIVGSTTFTDFFVVCLVAAFIITMNTATADGGRALYGISRAGMTVKQLGTLNRWHVPGNAMTVDMVINILFVLFIGNIFGVLAASNLGYVLAHMFALSGFVLLRRTARTGRDRSSCLGHLDRDRGTARRVVSRPDGRRLRMDAGRRRRLRRDEGEGHRRLGARDRHPALLLPPRRAGPGVDPLARGDADDAGRTRGRAAPGGDATGLAIRAVES